MRVLGMMYECDRCGYKTCAPAVFSHAGGDELKFDESYVAEWGVNMAEDLCPTCYKKMMDDFRGKLQKYSGERVLERHNNAVVNMEFK